MNPTEQSDRFAALAEVRLQAHERFCMTSNDADTVVMVRLVQILIPEEISDGQTPFRTRWREETASGRASKRARRE
jgi:hypothetical protein